MDAKSSPKSCGEHDLLIAVKFDLRVVDLSHVALGLGLGVPVVLASVGQGRLVGIEGAVQR